MVTNNINENELAAQLKIQLGEDLSITEDKYFTMLNIAPGRLLALMQLLKAEYGFDQLSNLTSVDFVETFEVVYHLYSIASHAKICVKTRIPADNPQVESVVDIWPGADWQEREVYDLMGIIFTGHPNLIRVLLPDDFEGHPLRKDFVRKEPGADA